MPLPMSTACMQIEENDGSVFAVPSSKKNQLPIIFGRARHWITTSIDSAKTWSPHNLSLCTVSTPYDERNGIRLTSWRRPELLKGTTHPSTTFSIKRKAGQLLQSDSQGVRVYYSIRSIGFGSEKPLPSHSLDSSSWESDVSVGVAFKKLFANMTSTSQVKLEEDIEPFDTDPWVQHFNNSIFNGKNILNNATLL